MVSRNRCKRRNIRENRKHTKEITEHKGPKIVVFGGGTGLSVLLRGLKEYTEDITAVVTVADDGGGSGVLREDLGMLPPGDIRNCIIALADTRPSMERLLQYRFKEGILKGQSFGNLFIAAMTGVYDSFEEAIKEMSNVLAVSGKVLPMTIEDVNLRARLENGTFVDGESKIPKESLKRNSKIDRIYLNPHNVEPLNETVCAIKDADIIILGPGSLYTSVIPNMMVEGIAKEIADSKATKIYIANVMTQPGETDNYDVLSHVKAVLKHANEDIVDYVVVNNEKIPQTILNKYGKGNSTPVYLDERQLQELNHMGITVIEGSFLDIKKNYIRHNALKISEIITSIER